MKVIATIIKNCTWKERLIIGIIGLFFQVIIFIAFILTMYFSFKEIVKLFKQRQKENE